MAEIKVSVIIVSYNVQYFLELCLHATLKALAGVTGEIIVIDNQSSDESCLIIKQHFPSVTLIENKDNVGFSKANNQGVAIAKGAYIHFLNPDTVIPEDFYIKSIAYLDQHPKAGALGPRLLDGTGDYAIDSKKSFPSFWTSVYKVMGLASLRPQSAFFNKYYAAHIAETETAAVDILSGCCLLVRKEAMDKAGGSFDESYFMYCEDVDLCHRIGLAGYQNVYFPETSIIHYKGESTRKLSYKYMKIFYEAHALFVKKYYPKSLGIIYITALRSVLSLRNVINWLRHIFGIFKMYVLDALLLTLVTIAIKNFWFDSISEVSLPESPSIFYKTIPLFVIIWMLSLFLNGAYDKPFSLFKAGRGMVIGTIIVLAGYGLMPLDLRYSRGVVLFSGMAGTIAILLARWITALLGWIKLVPRGKVDYKAAIISNEEGYTTLNTRLQHLGYKLDIAGLISVNKQHTATNLGSISAVKAIQETYQINEIIFNSKAVNYKDIIDTMQVCASKVFYKISTPYSAMLVGSNNLKHHAEAFSLEQHYKIATPSNKRNKRIIDICASLVLILIYPFLKRKVKTKTFLWTNLCKVLMGKCTWVGYRQQPGVPSEPLLPTLRPSILPTYIMVPGYEPSEYNYYQLASRYAISYNVLDDIRLLMKNLNYIGEKKI
jgi:GT2 family glycosyltransferase